MKKFDNQLPVLMYHRVVKQKSEAGHHNIYVIEKHFLRQMKYLKNNGFETITFRDLEANPSMDLNKKVIMTFDDGYIDNYTNLFPILKQFGFKAVVFQVTQLSQNEWGIKEGEPAINLLNKQQIKEMSDYGIEFGCHTQHHVTLFNFSEEIQRKEIAGCKADIEKIIEKPVISISYPFGAIGENTKQIVAESGIKYGISTNTGACNYLDDLLQIRRIEVSFRTTLFSFKKKVSGHYFEPSFSIF